MSESSFNLRNPAGVIIECPKSGKSIATSVATNSRGAMIWSILDRSIRRKQAKENDVIRDASFSYPESPDNCP